MRFWATFKRLDPQSKDYPVVFRFTRKLLLTVVIWLKVRYNFTGNQNYKKIEMRQNLQNIIDTCIDLKKISSKICMNLKHSIILLLRVGHLIYFYNQNSNILKCQY